MEIEKIRELFVEFYGEWSEELLQFDCACLNDSVCDMNEVYKKLKAITPEIDFIDEMFFTFEDDIYKSIKLDKRITNNCMPEVNIVDESGKKGVFYKELYDCLHKVPDEEYTLDFVLQSIFNHFIGKYNTLVADHNELVAYHKKFVDLFKSPSFDAGIHVKDDVKTKTEKDGFVYIASGGDSFYKIGRTINISNREKSLKTGNHLLRIFAYTKTDNADKLEVLIHKLFKHKNVGGEWFELTKDDLDDIIRSFCFSIALSYKDDVVEFVKNSRMEGEVKYASIFGGNYLDRWLFD